MLFIFKSKASGCSHAVGSRTTEGGASAAEAFDRRLSLLGSPWISWTPFINWAVESDLAAAEVIAIWVGVLPENEDPQQKECMCNHHENLRKIPGVWGVEVAATAIRALAREFRAWEETIMNSTVKIDSWVSTELSIWAERVRRGVQPTRGGGGAVGRVSVTKERPEERNFPAMTWRTKNDATIDANAEAGPRYGMTGNQFKSDDFGTVYGTEGQRSACP